MVVVHDQKIFSVQPVFLLHPFFVEHVYSCRHYLERYGKVMGVEGTGSFFLAAVVDHGPHHSDLGALDVLPSTNSRFLRIVQYFLPSWPLLPAIVFALLTTPLAPADVCSLYRPYAATTFF